MMIELIEQHDDKPSVYQETIKIKGTAFIMGHLLEVVRSGRRALRGRRYSDRLLRSFAARCSHRLHGCDPRSARNARDHRGHGRLEAIYQSYFDAAQGWDARTGAALVAEDRGMR